jgi:hypothetical protein
MSRTVVLLIKLALVIAAGIPAAAAVPPVIAYQGRLTQSDGTPFTGSKQVRFVIYDGTGTEAWSSGSVTVDFLDGLFAVKLGESPQPELSYKIFEDTSLTLGIAVESDPELVPRTRFTTHPYAFWANVAEYAKAADLAAGVPAGVIGATEVNRSEVQLRVDQTCPEGQFIRAID